MMHVALVCPDMTGHLNPMTTLGRALAARGHRVTLFGFPPAERFASGLGFIAIGADGYEQNILPGRARLATLTGVRALLLTGRLLHQVEVLNLRELPDAFARAKIDAVITDQVSPSGASVAAAMKLPVALACNALNMRQEVSVPPAILGWKYRSGPLGRMRNVVGNRLLSIAAGPIRRSINAWRRRHGLPGFSGANLSATEAVLEIAQQPDFFDFPRRDLPPTFHYTGPWHLPGRDQAIDFPWERLDGRPLIYASLGTLQNRLGVLFEAILQACRGLPVQLVLALGRRDAVWDQPVPDHAIVVPYAPQLELIHRAALVITHAGLNTALETLAAGVPMVCLPITNDQPGVAERVRWLGAGEVLKPSRATPNRLRSVIEAVLKSSHHRIAAERCRDRLRKSPTVHDAARLLEEKLAA